MNLGAALSAAEAAMFEDSVVPRYLSFFGGLASEMLLAAPSAQIAHLGCRTGESKNTTYLRVAGIGPSGKPSLTPTITLSSEETGESSSYSGDDAPTTRSVLDFSFDKTGRLILKNREGARKDPNLGAHPLVFP